MEYGTYLDNKRNIESNHGINPEGIDINPMLFGFQKNMVQWSLNKGRAAIFADCGLGKTPMQLSWAENISKNTNGKVLILTSLAVSY